MKITWEEKDIKPGVRYTKVGIAEVWMIGYLAETSSPKRYVSVSMSDGMVTHAESKDELVTSLNLNEYVREDFLPLLNK